MANTDGYGAHRVTHAIVVFPNYMRDLGGAEYARIGVRYAWVKCHYKGALTEIRIPARLLLNETDSFRMAEIAKRYAYENQ